MNLKLFTDEPAPLRELTEAFERWCRHARDDGRLRRASSEQVYRAMWQALAAWCASQVPPVSLRQLDETTLQAYIATRSGKAGPTIHCRRAICGGCSTWSTGCRPTMPMRRTARNAAAAGLIAAQPALRHVNAADAEPLPEHLRADEAKRMVAFLSGVRPRGGSGRPDPVSWQELRNRAAVALQLGAGLGLVRCARCASPTSSASVAASRTCPGSCVSRPAARHLSTTPRRTLAGRLLRHWMQVRAEQGIGGDWLFPSTRSGKPWGKVAQYEAARHVLDTAA